MARMPVRGVRTSWANTAKAASTTPAPGAPIPPVLDTDAFADTDLLDTDLADPDLVDPDLVDPGLADPGLAAFRRLPAIAVT
ncbi:hypothetical protein S58_11150 [Bradyrhizobium oligotrophicum S58]|uniref:Uncharacterized protein n=1 Tax=Bradyrhizobium oligotrophicum S58 TaxID=1245469 RepID=M4ZLN7_9BRAD|nr:hypothetical protein S58_11150 [Bradyrhizobium oligotrophicum S58]